MARLGFSGSCRHEKTDRTGQKITFILANLGPFLAGKLGVGGVLKYQLSGGTDEVQYQDIVSVMQLL
jgi:hypothetical protein